MIATAQSPDPAPHWAPEARSLWDGVLADYPGLAPWQRHVLWSACGAKHDEVSADRFLAEHGLTYSTASGMLHPRAEVAVRRDARVAMLRALRDLGVEAGE